MFDRSLRASTGDSFQLLFCVSGAVLVGDIGVGAIILNVAQEEKGATPTSEDLCVPDLGVSLQ